MKGITHEKLRICKAWTVPYVYLKPFYPHLPCSYPWFFQNHKKINIFDKYSFYGENAMQTFVLHYYKLAFLYNDHPLNPNLAFLNGQKVHISPS